jgi:GNAT superfamily N-acetyltransferase
MEFTITPFDPASVASDASVDELVQLLTAAQAVDVPDFPAPCRQRYLAMLRNPVSATRLDNYVARAADGRLVGNAEVRLPQRDNTDNAEVHVVVHPSDRRRGVGRALYAYTCEILRQLGRKRAMGMTTEALPGGPERDGAGRAFAGAMGAKDALQDVRRRLDLSTVDNAALDRMLAEAWTRAAGYSVVRWRDEVPDEYVADVGYLDSRLVTDAPIGDLAWEPEQIDTARIREGEAVRQKMGIRSYSTGMRQDASGRLVAVTTIGREHSTPEHAFQWITLVDPDHRGHRLGIIGKIENLRYALVHEPALENIDTWNAEVNTYMIAINEAMGFHPVDRWTAWQHEL